ncbi:hypothetical protein BDW66DRAFT_146193 [Aspergillus desertorum]
MQISEEIMEQIRVLPGELRHADEMFDAIARVTNGHGVIQARMASVKVSAMKREHHATAVDYINAFRSANEVCRRLGIETGAFIKHLRLLTTSAMTSRIGPTTANTL